MSSKDWREGEAQNEGRWEEGFRNRLEQFIYCESHLPNCISH